MAKRLPQFISKDEFYKLLEEAKKERDKFYKPRLKIYSPRGIRINEFIVAMILAFGSGMRISEIFGLKGKDKSWRIRPLTYQQIESNFIRVVGGKGQKDRQVPIPGKIFLKAGIKREDLASILPLKCDRRSMQRYISALALRVLNKKTSFHKLRHGFATHVIEQGMRIDQLQMFLGHEDLSTTQIYLHANPTQAIEKYKEIEF